MPVSASHRAGRRTGGRGAAQGMRLASRPPLARILAIDRALRAGDRPDASTLGRELEVNPGTVRRDVTYLRDQLGAPVEFDPARNGHRDREPGCRLPYEVRPWDWISRRPSLWYGDGPDLATT